MGGEWADIAQTKGKEWFRLRKSNTELCLAIRFNLCDNRSDMARGKRFDDLFESNRLSIAPTKVLSQGQLPLRISFYRFATDCKPPIGLPVLVGYQEGIIS